MLTSTLFLTFARTTEYEKQYVVCSEVIQCNNEENVILTFFQQFESQHGCLELTIPCRSSIPILCRPSIIVFALYSSGSVKIPLYKSGSHLSYESEVASSGRCD